MDNVQFTKPMRIGALVEFVGTVVYTDDNITSSGGNTVGTHDDDESSSMLAVVQVLAFECDQTTGDRQQTNKLTFVFKPCVTDASTGKSVICRDTQTRVMPSTYEETVRYLDGRRILNRLML